MLDLKYSEEKIKEIWDRVLKNLEDKMDSPTFEGCLKKATLMFQDNEFIVNTHNKVGAELGYFCPTPRKVQ